MPEFVVDLRKEIDLATRTLLRQIGFERPFGIVTAHNPMGVAQPADVNARLAASLQIDVAKLQATHRHLDACSPDRSHCEQSIAIVLELQSLIVLACRYNQLAIFWFDGDVFWIVPARSSNARLRLPASV